MIALLGRMKLLWSLRDYGTKIAHLFLDRRVSPGLKLATSIMAVLIVSPLDLFGDIPILGLFDDVALLMLLGMLFVKLCPTDIVAEYSGAARERARPLKNVTPPG